MNIKYDMFLLLALMGTASAGAQNKKAAKPKAKTTAVKPAMSAHAKALFDEMLPNTQKIFVIDSMVVSKDNILEAIPLPATYGRMEKTADFFNNPAKEGYAFVNGFGNKCYYTEMGTDSISRLYMQEKVGNEWGERIPVKEINERFTDISFPFMSSDGLTLYFSAKSEEEGLGKRDIYMTKYDAEEGKFLQAENIGLPFNSMDDDVIYVEADADKMAWFGTSRRQSEGKICVYAFVPSQQRQNYQKDEMTDARLKSLASLIRIRDTWTTPEIRDQEVNRLAAMKEKAKSSKGATENADFIVNDNLAYHSAQDFRSDETRRTYYDIIRLRNDIKSKENSLEALRDKYHYASASERNKLARQIMSLEDKAEQTRRDLKTLSDNLRRAEMQLIRR